MNLLQKNNFFISLSYSLVLTLVSYSLNHFFFWDTILFASKQAEFYCSTKFATLLLPNDIDRGHIPTFGIYIALIWKLFGKTLVVSHLAMLPFVVGIVFQLQRLRGYFINSK